MLGAVSDDICRKACVHAAAPNYVNTISDRTVSLLVDSPPNDHSALVAEIQTEGMDLFTN